MFDQEFSVVRQVIPPGSNEQCSDRPTGSAIGFTASCVFELSGSVRDATNVIANGVPATYSRLRQSESGLSYIHDFGNDSYHLRFAFVPVSPDRTRVEMELESAAN